MKSLRRMICTMACIVMTAAMTACGSSSTGDEETFSIWLYSGVDSSYYTDYSENPVISYTTQNMTWGDQEKKIGFEFWIPASGSEEDNWQTMMGSGDYADVLSGVIGDAPKTMLENGVVMDLTDYVKQYMPNYLSFLESHPDIKSNAVDIIDGEEHYIGIRSGCESRPYYSFGYEYRRDWIVKYGTNPVTGEAFTGGYTDPENVDSWEDDVVFPSGGSDPVYISDWEWMFEIFEKAYADLGIEDTYCTSMYYPGFTWAGGLCSCFGGGVPVWYEDENGTVQFGGDSDQMRAYLQCLNTWYSKGWLDPDFYQRTSDSFYAIDDTNVRQGKVGLWYGVQGELGGRLDMGDDLTEGICVYGCAFPINDVYGDESCQNVVPNCVLTTSCTGSIYYVSTAAEGKDIGALLSYFDYFYSEEGSLMTTIGLNAEQIAESGNDFYANYGLEGGTYTLGDDGRYKLNDILINDSGDLRDASRSSLLPGITLVESVDQGYDLTYEHSLASWIQYENTGFFQGTAVTNNIPSDVIKICDNIRTKVLDYMTLNAPEFIRGNTDPFDDADWDVWCKTIAKYNYQKASEIYQPYCDQYSIN
jgi:ABC-type glycerol-3-phosphate transport system substrate-binding protein